MSISIDNKEKFFTNVFSEINITNVVDYKITELRSSLRSYVARINLGLDDKQIIIKQSRVINLDFEGRLLKFFNEKNIPCPKYLGYLPKDNALILEDLGDDSIESLKINDSLLKEAINVLAEIHNSGVKYHDELLSIFISTNNLKQIDLKGYVRHLSNITYKRIECFLSKSQITGNEKNIIFSFLFQAITELVEGNYSCFNVEPSFLIVNDIKPHHFIIHNNTLKIIDFERITMFGLPQFDLVFLLENPKLCLSDSEIINYIEYYLSISESKWVNFQTNKSKFLRYYNIYKFIYKLFIAETEHYRNYNLKGFDNVSQINELIKILDKHVVI